MCGIVGAVAERDVTPILLEGLQRLEYRGYDSAGLVLVSEAGDLQRVRTTGKVARLREAIAAKPIAGRCGIAHTRWATHGTPTDRNAHPHISGDDDIAIVHNGIIENYERLREQQRALGYEFSSETDTEVAGHQIHSHYGRSRDLLAAVQAAVRDLEGAYAFGVVSRREPSRLIAVRKGSPLVIGIGLGEHFIASDVAALLPVTQRFIYLEDGDIADVRRDSLTIYDQAGNVVEREIRVSQQGADSAERGEYRHFMIKEIYEQPSAIAATLEGRITEDRVLEAAFGPQAAALFPTIKRVQIVACGTSFHAGSVARYWFEGHAGIPCNVEIASEFRYRGHAVSPDTLFVTISQSGETADTLSALRVAKEFGYAATLAVCNVPESSLVRESDMAVITRAGPEIGVASTKAFTTQLSVLLLLVAALGRHHRLDRVTEQRLVQALRQLPGLIEQALRLEDQIEKLAERFADKQHTLFLGRGPQYPIAQEGALKLKETSYIHAEAYPAGELKHGPMALIDDLMPVVAVAPRDDLVDKLKSNLQEVHARGGIMHVFADESIGLVSENGFDVFHMPSSADLVAPILYTVPLQLLAYHVAVLKGTDVDQPRNLAKAVTVE
jgi:glucosamine--fructose-6-phosphate aminotransferase (isomerizing)